MKTKILKAFFVAALVGGTIGSAFAVPENSAECTAAAGQWEDNECVGIEEEVELSGS
jgi:hypothetical protein